MSNMECTKNPRAKGTHFLFLRRHMPCYQQSSPEEVPSGAEKRLNLRKNQLPCEKLIFHSGQPVRDDDSRSL
jgi:hypothetical protein